MKMALIASKLMCIYDLSAKTKVLQHLNAGQPVGTPLLSEKESN